MEAYLDAKEGGEEVVEILPANETAVNTFLAVQTQWRVGMAGATGLDYPSLESTMRMLSVDDVPDTFARVQVMEREALAVWREQSES